jgi:S1-C subfamily serine protease
MKRCIVIMLFISVGCNTKPSENNGALKKRQPQEQKARSTTPSGLIKKPTNKSNSLIIKRKPSAAPDASQLATEKSSVKINVKSKAIVQSAAKSVQAPKAQHVYQVNAMQRQAAIIDDETEYLPKRRIINGPNQFDSRVDPQSLDPKQLWAKKMLSNSFSVAVVVEKANLKKISAGLYQVDDSRKLKSAYQLCPGEAFADQPVVGMGTAFVIGTRQMLTAGHVFSGPPENYAVIFGYEIISKTGTYERLVSADSVYFPTKLAKQSPILDIRLFEVDRDIKAPAFKWSTERQLAIGEPVYMIGHPYGLPKKIAANASIQDNTGLGYFYTTLDAFAGNSGSPVFRLQTNELIGVLVSGEVDFKWNGSCNVSNICRIPYCRGEKVIRITAIKDFLDRN